MTKNVTQNVTNSNSEDLTELYHKGKLPKGYYYLKKPDGEVMIITPSLRFMVDGYSILAEVPSFEELQNQVFIIKSRESEIVKLKELLKECQGLMNCTKDWACTEATENLITKIDQVLADNKIQANTVACNKIQENE